MYLWGVSPIRLIHIRKPKAGTTKSVTEGWCFLFPNLILVWVVLHRANELHIAILVCSPRGYDAPKVELPVIADFAEYHFYFAPVGDSDDAPVAHGLGLHHFLFVAFDLKLLDGLLIFLVGRGLRYELYGTW